MPSSTIWPQSLTSSISRSDDVCSFTTVWFVPEVKLSSMFTISSTAEIFGQTSIFTYLLLIGTDYESLFYHTVSSLSQHLWRTPLQLQLHRRLSPSASIFLNASSSLLHTQTEEWTWPLWFDWRFVEFVNIWRKLTLNRSTSGSFAHSLYLWCKVHSIDHHCHLWLAQIHQTLFLSGSRILLGCDSVAL